MALYVIERIIRLIRYAQPVHILKVSFVLQAFNVEFCLEYRWLVERSVRNFRESESYCK